MKRRTTVMTEAAQDLQLQISRTKKSKARELLESRLITTYLESFVDLDAKPEPIAVIICTRDYGSRLKSSLLILLTRSNHESLRPCYRCPR